MCILLSKCTFKFNLKTLMMLQIKPHGHKKNEQKYNLNAWCPDLIGISFVITGPSNYLKKY